MLKKELRKIYKEQRANISSKEKLKLDDLMLLQLQKMYFEDSLTLLTYWPIGNHNEPNTHLYSSFLRHTIPGLQIAYPVSDFTDSSMKAILINEDTAYTTNQYGITEPKEGIELKPTDLDLIFVPLLICDEQGYRVGYGKGFYDKFLAQCKSDAITLGFNYFSPIDKIQDTDEYDIPLNYCITPEHIYEF